MSYEHVGHGEWKREAAHPKEEVIMNFVINGPRSTPFNLSTFVVLTPCLIVPIFSGSNTRCPRLYHKTRSSRDLLCYTTYQETINLPCYVNPLYIKAAQDSFAFLSSTTTTAQACDVRLTLDTLSGVSHLAGKLGPFPSLPVNPKRFSSGPRDSPGAVLSTRCTKAVRRRALGNRSFRERLCRLMGSGWQKIT